MPRYSFAELWHGSRADSNGKQFTLRHRVVLLYPEVRKAATYRDFADERIEIPYMRDALDLESIPIPSTLSKTFDCSEMAVQRVLLNVLLADLPVSGVTGIDSARFERARASSPLHEADESHHPTVEDDTVGRYGNQRRSRRSRDDARKHDTQIGPQAIRRNVESIVVLTGDKGYDEQTFGDSPVTAIVGHFKHREFTSLHKAWYARLSIDFCHRRNVNETVDATIKQKFGAFVRSRHWWKQFHGLAIECVVRNRNRRLTISNGECDCP